MYTATGNLPHHIHPPEPNLSATAKDSRVDDISFVAKDVPLCKDHHLKGECQRGKKCKFLHMTDNRSFHQESNEQDDIPEAKRRHHENDLPNQSFTSYNFREGTNSHCSIPASFIHNSDYPIIIDGSNVKLSSLFEENFLLRRKVDELRKQVSDLQATNEFLLDQNAHLRIQGKLLPSVSLASSITVPVTTSVTTLGPYNLPTVQTVQAIHHGCMNVTSMPTVQTVYSLSTQPTPLVSIAAPITINHQTALAPQNSMSAATATVTLTPTINAAAMQLGSNSLAFSGSNGNSIVSYDSYPIMTQSLMAPS